MSEQKWYTIVGVGNEGVEMLHSSTDELEASSKSEMIELRARLNGHRHIKVYSWLNPYQVTFNNVSEIDYQNQAKQIF